VSHIPLRVVKVGGSLFDAPHLPERLLGWFDEMPPARSVVIAGGGRMVDDIRRLDQLRPMGEAAAHWAAISVLDVTAWMLATWMQEFDITSDFAGLTDQLFDTEDPIIFAPGRFLKETEPSLMGTRLTKTWEVTSDSIAVRLGTIILADEIVLLKPTPPPLASECPRSLVTPVNARQVTDLAIEGYVDTYLPRLIDEAPPMSIGLLPG